MRKEDKAVIIETIAATLKEYSCFYLVETAGLNAEKTCNPRRACSKADIKLWVVKNTLLHKALEQIDGGFQRTVSRTCRSHLGDVLECGQRSCQAAQGFCEEGRRPSPP